MSSNELVEESEDGNYHVSVQVSNLSTLSGSDTSESLENKKEEEKRYPKSDIKATEMNGYVGCVKVIKFPITTTYIPTVKEDMIATPPERKLWINEMTKEL